CFGPLFKSCLVLLSANHNLRRMVESRLLLLFDTSYRDAACERSSLGTRPPSLSQPVWRSARRRYRSGSFLRLLVMTPFFLKQPLRFFRFASLPVEHRPEVV